MASAPLREIPTLPGMDVHPPAYFAALNLWMSLAGRSEFALRYLSLVFSVLTVALLIRFGRELGGKRAGLWAGALAALSPFYIAYAQEVRMYAMLTFPATASVYLQWIIINDKLSKRRWWWVGGYVLATAATLYTHYFTFFMLVFQNLVWLGWAFAAWRRTRSRRAPLVWIGSQLGVLLLFLPQLMFASRQITGYANPNLNPPSLLHYITRNWQAYTLGLTIDPASAMPYLIALFALPVIALFLPAGSGRRSVVSGRLLTVALLIAWLLVPLTLYFLVLQIRPSYEPRYMMLVTPALFLLFGLAFGTKRWPQPLLGLAAAGILLVGLRSYYFDASFFKDDSARVTAWLAAETTPNDVVLVDVPHPFHYYADRIPAPTDYLFVDVHTAADTLNRAALGRDRLYWVTWWGSDTDPRGVIPFLLQKQAGAIVGSKQFKGYRADWWELGNDSFSLPAELPPADVNFDNVLRLDGLAYSETLSAGEAGWATLHFSQLAPTDISYKVSLRLRASDGRALAQVDRLLLNDRHFQTADWPIEDPALNQAVNVYLLPLNDPAYTGPLTLEAVIYNAETLASIAAYGAPTTNDDFVSAQIGAVVVK